MNLLNIYVVNKCQSSEDRNGKFVIRIQNNAKKY